MKRENATIIAFLTAPLVAVIVFIAITPTGNNSLLFLVIFYYFFSIIPTLLLGLPGFYLLRHLRLIRWWSALLAGLTIGIAVPISSRGLNSDFLVEDMLTFGPPGACAGFVFWFIWSRGRDE